MNNTQLSKPAKTPQVHAKKSILIIDDSQDMLELGKLVLEMEGFEVLTAESGEAALVLLTGTHTPHLILLDMQLGDMTGDHFLKLLEEQHSEILKTVPVVFLTGTDIGNIPAGRASGHIKKTAGVESLIASVHEFLKQGVNSPLRN